MNLKFIRMSLLVRAIVSEELSGEELRKKVFRQLKAYHYIDESRMDSYTSSTFEKDKAAIEKKWEITINGKTKIYRIDDEVSLKNVEKIYSDFHNTATFLSSLNSDMMLPSYVIPETRKNTGLQHFQTISEAIQNKKKIKISYFDYITELEKLKEIWPYKIKQKDFKWYVLATDDSIVPFKSYALERITTIETLRKFDPKIIDFEEPYKDAIGMFTDGIAEEIIVEYDHRDGHYLKANPIHHSQEIISETADRIQFRFFVKPNNDFLMELLKRSWSLKVMQPESLKERMMGFWREAMERNK